MWNSNLPNAPSQPGYDYSKNPPPPPYSPPAQDYPGFGSATQQQQTGYGPPHQQYLNYPPNPAPQGYYPNPAPPAVQQPIIVPPSGPTSVVVVGTGICANGHTPERYFTCLGVCCAIVLFPVGILCCLAMMEKKCSKCGALM